MVASSARLLLQSTRYHKFGLKSCCDCYVVDLYMSISPHAHAWCFRSYFEYQQSVATYYVADEQLLLSALTAHVPTVPDSVGICLAVLVGRGGSLDPEI